MTDTSIPVLAQGTWVRSRIPVSDGGDYNEREADAAGQHSAQAHGHHRREHAHRRLAQLRHHPGAVVEGRGPQLPEPAARPIDRQLGPGRGERTGHRAVGGHGGQEVGAEPEAVGAEACLDAEAEMLVITGSPEDLGFVAENRDYAQPLKKP